MALINWCVSYTLSPKKKERNELHKIWLPFANISHYKCLLNIWHLFALIFIFFLNFLTVSCWESCGEALVRKEQAYFPCFEMGGKLYFSLIVYTLILDGQINYVYGTLGYQSRLSLDTRDLSVHILNQLF